jgi:hypothetical protein
LPVEQPPGVVSQFEESHAAFEMVPVRRIDQAKLMLPTKLLIAPLSGHGLEEGVVDLAIELVDMHGVYCVLETFPLRAVALERCVAFLSLLGVAVAQRRPYQLEDLFVEAEAAEHFRELGFEHLFTRDLRRLTPR